MEQAQKEDLRNITRIVLWRSFNTSPDDYHKHGFTQRCPGCRAILLGTTRQKHSKAGRQRMATEMADEEKVKTTKRKSRTSRRSRWPKQERDDVGAQTYCRVEGSSSSVAALDKTDVAFYAGAKVERSEDGSADLAERLNKRIKKTAEAEGMEVA